MNQIKIIFSIFIIFFPFISCASNNQSVVVSSISNDLYRIGVGDKVFLNACGGNPQNYEKKPLNLIDRIVEVPNIVTKIEISPYERPFLVKANSTIVLPNNEKIFIQLDNFRNLKITDEKDNLLLKRKVSGATSIYEYRFNEKVIAWGVGWHLHCKDYFEYTDFTVMRTFIPYLNNGNIQIETKILQPNISSFQEFYLDSQFPLFINAKTFHEGQKPWWCYYCGFEFFEINNLDGYKPITNTADNLIENYQIDFSSVKDFVPVIHFLSGNKDNFDFFKIFLRDHYKKIIFDLIDNYYFNPIYDKNGNFTSLLPSWDYANAIPENYEIKRYINTKIFSEKNSFINFFEKKCDLEKYNSFGLVALECFPMHFFFFDDLGKY